MKPVRGRGIAGLPAAAAAALLCSLTLLFDANAQDEPVAPAFQFDEARQFDFWTGAWRVSLRTQQDDLRWQESVIADARVWRILDGKAILELWDSEPIKGFSLRWFDMTSNRWNLWLNWPSPNRSAGSKLEGQFRHGRGEFFSSAAAPDGGTILTRYTFSDIAADRLRWDDAYSTDAGKTWTGNWIMEFSRSAAVALPPDRETNAHTYDFGDRCTLAEFKTLNALAGRWQGTVADTDHFGVRTEHPATLSIHRILDGCAVMAFTHAPAAQPATREFRLLTFNTVTGKYEENLLDNEPGTAFRQRLGEQDGGSLQFENSDEGHRVSWSSGADGTLTIREFRVPAAGGSLAQRRFQLTRE